LISVAPVKTTFRLDREPQAGHEEIESRLVHALYNPGARQRTMAEIFYSKRL
jgi:hypothetical protein